MTGTETGAPRWARGLCVGLVLLTVTLGLALGRAVEQGRADMAASDSAFDAGKLELSLQAARRAATWYVPGASHVADAEARMRAIAVGAEASGRLRMAQRAWQSLRGAQLETRHLGRGDTQTLRDAERNAVRLLAAEAAAHGQSLSVEALTAEYRRPRADGRYVASYGMGLLLMVAAGALALRASRFRDARSGVWHWTAFGCGLLLWVVAAIQA